jgi:hypothetical protein
MSNIGNLILAGLQNFVTGAARGGGGKMLEAIAAQLGKPAGTQQFSNAELTTLAQRMEQQEMQRRGMLANQPRMALPGPAAPMQAAPRPMIFEQTYEIEDQGVFAVPQVIPQPVMQQMPVAEPVMTVQPAAASTVEVPVEEGDRTQEVVNEALAMALEDIRAGRRAHDWVDFALDKWDRPLLNALVSAADDSARIMLIQQYADPQLFGQLAQVLMDTAHPEYYSNFIENVHNLLEEASKAAPVSAI